MILVGIYCSATSLANDSKLRQIIRQFAVTESKFFVSIGTAQIQKEIEDRVMRVAKKQQDILIGESGVYPSLTELEIKEYLKSVLEEIEVVRKTGDSVEKDE